MASNTTPEKQHQDALEDFDWKVVGRRLLGEAKYVRDIDVEEETEQRKRDRMLDKWSEIKGPLATYGAILEIFENLSNRKAADGVKKLLMARSTDHPIWTTIPTARNAVPLTNHVPSSTTDPARNLPRPSEPLALLHTHERIQARAFTEVETKVDSVIGLKALLNDLARFDSKWFNIGVLLMVPVNELKEIPVKSNEILCLQNVLIRWLSLTPTPMKSDLVKMLQSNAIDDQRDPDLPDTRPLGIDDFDAILSLLSPLSRRWEDIAIQLDVDTRQLPSMENTSESNAVMLRMMLQKLQGVAPPPTLHDLVDALSSSTIGQRAYAEELKQKYCPSGSSNNVLLFPPEEVPVQQASQETVLPLLHDSSRSMDYESGRSQEGCTAQQMDIENEQIDHEGNGSLHLESHPPVLQQIHVPPSNNGLYQIRICDPAFFPHHEKKRGQIEMDGGKLPYDCYEAYKDSGKQPYDCYEAYKPLSLPNIKLSFKECAPINKQPGSNFAKYEMGRFPHGIALIINNETFMRQKIREGTDIDEGNLIQTFRYLGYKVEVHRDKKKAEIDTIFDEMKARDHSAYDSFVCCLLTHGADGGFIYGSDSEKLELNGLISKLNAANCKSLYGKPKLFFIQACRGKGKSPAVHMEIDQVQRVDSDSDTPVALPNETDFFFGYATTPTMVAWRDLDNGSWYVNELCEALVEHSSYADLTSMHEIVQRKIAEVYEINDFKQTTENNSRLTKKVYFFNGAT